MIGRFRQPEVEPAVDPRGFDDFDLRLGDVMRGERATLGKSLLDVQRELKIKATYIAAIENADPSAFETPGFIAGYVRSYARYLELDPEWAYKAFCAEGNFETAHGMSAAASSKRTETVRSDGSARDPFIDSALSFAPARSGFFSGIEPGAIGSMAVLVGLIGLIGYGGYAVLAEVQKVQFVPVEQTPGVYAELDPLASAREAPPEGEEDSGITATAPDRFDRLYRPQALDVPVLVARDGPISTLDPRAVGTLSGVEMDDVQVAGGMPNAALSATSPIAQPGDTATLATETELAEAATDDAAAETPAPGVQVVAEGGPEVVMFAVRPSWVRVRSADGSVIYEKIMNEGDRFVLPATEDPATLRTGESGAIYFAVNGQTYGPAGRNGQVTKNLSLAATSLTESYQVADMKQDNDLARVVAELTPLAPTRPAQTGE